MVAQSATPAALAVSGPRIASQMAPTMAPTLSLNLAGSVGKHSWPRPVGSTHTTGDTPKDDSQKLVWTLVLLGLAALGAAAVGASFMYWKHMTAKKRHRGAQPTHMSPTSDGDYDGTELSGAEEFAEQRPLLPSSGPPSSQAPPPPPPPPGTVGQWTSYASQPTEMASVPGTWAQPQMLYQPRIY
eukprot:TRINITY_DN11345_c0_g1_i4.p1 TRINITY_DN11345_c0_g1~~TRINITY_DN11345_c0_g1_i4.p1  ORF type:complete len:185 (+),score=27.28 TRINITY_DN11345_c0_g1_i4:438-992(+)